MLKYVLIDKNYTNSPIRISFNVNLVHLVMPRESLSGDHSV